jgi:hypothetical protein
MTKYRVYYSQPEYIGFYIEKLLPDYIQERDKMKKEIIRLAGDIMDNGATHVIWDKKRKKGKAVLELFPPIIYHAPLTKTKAEIESEKNVYKDQMKEILQKIDNLNLAAKDENKTQEQILLEASNIRKEVRILINDYMKKIIENNIIKGVNNE